MFKQNSKKLTFHFDNNLQYQTNAVNSVVSLFENSYKKPQLHVKYDLEQEVNSNNLVFDKHELLQNIQNVQQNNQLAKTANISQSYFTVEMETGTGKTYVYLKTIFELHQEYNLTKFIIVVPSIAIREGVLKSLAITKEHFKNLYNNLNFDYYMYDEKKVRDFATNNTLQIMVINVQSFDKERNKININNEVFLGEKPIKYIQATNPIIILDEPQSASSTDKQKKAIQELNPLCQIAYSATHKDVTNLVYRLNAIDAYQQKLVKEIYINSITSESNANYDLQLISTNNTNNRITAKIELLMYDGKLKKIIIKNNDDLYSKSNNNPLYQNDFRVREIIIGEKHQQCVEFTNGKKLKHLNQDDEQIMSEQKAQIYATVEEHFKKQKQLQGKNIKVLSLFFIDKVANYKENGQKTGKFAKIFEVAFNSISAKEEYKDVIPFNANDTHNGYFSVDKDTNGNRKVDKDTYSLIMRDKEKLLNFNEPTRFIFSHSALKEGWDNPNVFQICTLNYTKSIIKKRQEIGRGLRLCVNSSGERVYDTQINRLTVITNTAYELFAKELQKELTDEGLIFGIVEYSEFLQIATVSNHEIAKELFNSLVNNRYLNKKGDILDKFNPEDKHFDLVIEDKFKAIKPNICEIIKQHMVKGKLIKNAKAKVSFNYHKDLSPYFKEIWNKIKHKTIYKVHFNNAEFEQKCIKAINTLEKLQKPVATLQQASLDVNKAGVKADLLSERSIDIVNNNAFHCYNIVDELLGTTELTKISLINILLQVDSLESFFNQPRKYITMLSKTIKHEKASIMLEGLKYEKIDCIYECEITDKNQIIIELSNYYEIQNSYKSVAPYLNYDSEVEKSFAKELDTNEDVLFFFKIPTSFKINTPIGNYSPDWAIIKNNHHNETIQKLYFIAETKGTTDINQLRSAESTKIKYGEKHFSALNEDISFQVVNKLKDLKAGNSKL